jgi:hypothetical protein
LPALRVAPDPPPYYALLRRASHRDGGATPSYLLRRARVLAAFLAAAERTAEPLVRAALRAAAERCDALRREAALRACRDSALREAVLRGSRLSTFVTARDTRGRRRGLRLPCPTS